MPPTRPWPQTLLLTVLSLLIAVATIMLACEPAARPASDGGMATLPVTQPAAGGVEDMPTMGTTAAPPTVGPTRACGHST